MTRRNLYLETLNALEDRGVTVEDLVETLVIVQGPYIPNIREFDLDSMVNQVLMEMEVQNIVLTAITMDKLSEENQFKAKLYEDKHFKVKEDLMQDRILADESLYGVDEVMAYGICNMFGSLAIANFGHIDLTKPGIVGKLDTSEKQCNTFLDDIAGAIVAAAAAILIKEFLQ